MSICPVCSYSCGTLIYNGGNQPLSTLAWPETHVEAKDMRKYPHIFVQCLSCSHVWNSAFNYDVIPYTNKPNLMFNNGSIWKNYLMETRNMLLEHLPSSPTIIDIGCGEGHFIRGFSELFEGAGRFIGFDPNCDLKQTGRGVEFYAQLFDPFVDASAYNPDLIIIRHVFEHMTNPAEFIERLGFAVSKMKKPCYLFAEVPCADIALRHGRTTDFFYEHVSQFTTKSFTHLMSKGGIVSKVAHGYHGEVIYGIVKLGITTEQENTIHSSDVFQKNTEINTIQICNQLNSIYKKNFSVAIWGGTGKASAFINQYGVDAIRFPLVVDSDLNKVGTYVPGMGQLIQFRDILKNTLIDIVIIPSQWRARDILDEIKREGITVGCVLIEYEGMLVDLVKDKHPY